MPKKREDKDSLFLRGLAEYDSTLRAIENKHGIRTNDLARKLVAAACSFYDEHGWFAFPVVIIPEKFQLESMGTHLAAAEERAPYEVTPAAKKKVARIKPTPPLPERAG